MLDFSNEDIKNYITDKEKVEKFIGYSEQYMTWSKYGSIAVSILFCWTIIFPLMFYIQWLHLKSKKYIITDKRILIVSGILNKSVKDIAYNKITDTQVKQSYLAKLLWNCGNIKLNTAGSSNYEGILERVDNPFELKKLIDKHIK